MPVLVGPTDAAPYSGISYWGFSGGNVNIAGFTATDSGTTDVLETRILDFSTNTLAHAALYEQVGGAGAIQLVGEVDIAPSASPQLTAMPGVTITAGNVYWLAIWGDVSATDGAVGMQLASDTSVTQGTGSLGSTYDPEPDPLSLPGGNADGQIYWNIDGTLSAGGANLGLRETFHTDPDTNSPIPDGDYSVAVLDTSLNVLVATQTIASVGGVITVDSQSLGAVDDVVWLAIRSVGETDPNIASIVVPVSVIDLDA